MTARRPGLPTLAHRIGDHSSFFETLVAALGRTPVVRDGSEIDSWLVTAEHIPDVDRLVRVLSTSRDVLIVDLWSRFGDDDRQALLDGDDGDVEGLLVSGLNSIVRGESIHSADRWSGRVLELAIRDLLAADDLAERQGQQLNRLLLEVALGRHVSAIRTVRPLDRLTTRDPSDFSVALLDAWAVVGDIVSFYQERLVDESYLRTATERRSVLELARLVGYELRPGVAASAFVAFALQDGHKVTIPAGTLAKSTPPPGELPQPFETSDALDARAEWNELFARCQRPQIITTSNVNTIDQILVEGTNSKLRPNDVLLFAFGDRNGQQCLRTVRDVVPDENNDRSEVRLLPLTTGMIRRRTMSVIERHQDLKQFDVEPGAMTRDVDAALEGFVARSATNVDSDFIAARNHLNEELEAFRKVAAANRFDRLEPWLSSLSSEFASASVMAPTDSTFEGSAAATSGPAVAMARAEGEGLGPRSVSPIGALRRTGVLDELRRAASVQPANRRRLAVDMATQLAESGDLRPRLLAALRPEYRSTLYQALGGAVVSAPSPVEVYAFRVRSPLYGYNAPERPYVIDPNTGVVERSGDPDPHESDNIVDLASPFDGILPGSWVVVRPLDLPRLEDDSVGDGGSVLLISAPAAAGSTSTANSEVLVARAADVDPTLARADYGVASPITRIRLADPSGDVESVRWFDDESYGLVRGTSVLAQAERLELANEPINEDVGGDEIELDRLHDGIEPGRWVIVAGERVLDGVDGVEGAELVMVAGVEQRADPDRPGEQLHTFLRLAGTAASGGGGLSFTYRRPTVRIYGNVVASTNGESNQQVLGSGDGRVANQRFDVRGAPLTHVSAPIPSGSAPELEVRVNGVRWHRVDNMHELDPDERVYLIRTDDDAVTSVVFGDGIEGARLPSGAENVEATYRIGLGPQGNVGPRVIDTLIDRPLGVKEVINPIRASGGAERESLDDARVNTPKALLALDRLVAVRDYADLASTFAGVAKADAQLLVADGQRLIHLTVALAGAAPLDRNSDLYRNLRQTLAEFGDRRTALQIDDASTKLLLLSAGIRVHPDHRWDDVEPRVRVAIATAFGFEVRPLARGLAASEVVAVIDGVRGVDYVDLDVIDTVSEEDILLVSSSEDESGGSVLAGVAKIGTNGEIVAAELVYADPAIRDTVVLQELSR